MKLLFLGDVVGRPGRTAVCEYLPAMRAALDLDFVVVNGENAAAGFGITQKIAEALFHAGADVITTGNHVWDQREILLFIDSDERVIRPLNYPPGTPGRGAVMLTTRKGERVLVVNAMGRLFMDALDDPFRMVDEAIAAHPLGEAVDAILVDFHAEATSEKMAMGHHLDGRVSLVVGTHTHVPTADAQVLPHGSGYLTDAGMCGDYDSVIGMDKVEPLARFTRKMSGGRLEAAGGTGTVCGVLIETDGFGLCRSIEPIRIGGRLGPAGPWRPA